MTGTPDGRAYARGIEDALLALGRVYNQPLDVSGNHVLSDCATWEIHEIYREAVLAACRARLGRVPAALRRAGLRKVP